MALYGLLVRTTGTIKPATIVTSVAAVVTMPIAVDLLLWPNQRDRRGDGMMKSAAAPTPLTINPMARLDIPVANDIMKKPTESKASPSSVVNRVPNLSESMPHTILMTVSAQKKPEIIVPITACDMFKVSSIVGTT